MNDLKDIWDGSKINTEINERYSRLKIGDRIKKIQNERKGEELSEERMVKGLHKIFQAVLNKLNNPLPTL